MKWTNCLESEICWQIVAILFDNKCQKYTTIIMCLQVHRNWHPCLEEQCITRRFKVWHILKLWGEMGGIGLFEFLFFYFDQFNIFVSKKYIVKISIIASKHKIYPKDQITLTQTSSLLKVCSKSKILWFY